MRLNAIKSVFRWKCISIKMSVNSNLFFVVKTYNARKKQQAKFFLFVDSELHLDSVCVLFNTIIWTTLVWHVCFFSLYRFCVRSILIAKKILRFRIVQFRFSTDDVNVICHTCCAIKRVQSSPFYEYYSLFVQIRLFSFLSHFPFALTIYTWKCYALFIQHSSLITILNRLFVRPNNWKLAGCATEISVEKKNHTNRKESIKHSFRRFLTSKLYFDTWMLLTTAHQI